jgi:hypothetical protein
MRSVTSSRRVLLAVLIGITPPTLLAQDHPSDPPVCLGFSFGPWTPALDWRAAGHGARIDTSHMSVASTGRDWAMDGMAGIEDSIVLLFPKWWPVGVAVTLPSRRPAPGDTVTGRAVALVADVKARVPTSRVRAWAVPCGGGSR